VLLDAGAGDISFRSRWALLACPWPYQASWNGRDTLIVSPKLDPKVELMRRHFTFFEHFRAAELYFDKLNNLIQSDPAGAGQICFLGMLTAPFRSQAIRQIAKGQDYLLGYLELKRTDAGAIEMQRRVRAERQADATTSR
jgi:hypothetical protein